MRFSHSRKRLRTPAIVRTGPSRVSCRKARQPSACPASTGAWFTDRSRQPVEVDRRALGDQAVKRGLDPLRGGAGLVKQPAVAQKIGERVEWRRPATRGSGRGLVLGWRHLAVLPVSGAAPRHRA